MYYVISEALANAAKHSHASEVSVTVARMAGVRVTAADDGVGGAALGRGSGLIGLVDRGRGARWPVYPDSPSGPGTTISIELPLDSSLADERAPV